MSAKDKDAREEQSAGAAKARAKDKAITFECLTRDRRISHGAVRLFLLLNTYANKYGRSCFPAQDTLQKALGCSAGNLTIKSESKEKRAKDTWMRQLIRHGYITIERYGRNQVRYVLNFSSVAKTSNARIAETGNASVAETRNRSLSNDLSSTNGTPSGRVAKRNADTLSSDCVGKDQRLARFARRRNTRESSLSLDEAEAICEEHDYGREEALKFIADAKAGKVSGKEKTLRARLESFKRRFDDE